MYVRGEIGDKGEMERREKERGREIVAKLKG